MSDTIYLVADEEASICGLFTAESHGAAANAALKEWGIEADPGYLFHVVTLSETLTFKMTLHMEAAP